MTGSVVSSRLPWPGLLPAVGGLIAATAAAALAAAGRPTLALAVPAFAVGAVVAARRPEILVLGALVVAAAEGSIQAFAGVTANGPTYALLIALLGGLIGRLAFTRRRRPIVVWPWLLPVVGYVAITAAAVPFAESLDLGLLAFREGAFFALVAVALALLLHDDRAQRRIVRGIILLALAVGLYALVRWILGPSPEELAVASGPGRNLEIDGRIPAFGSFSLRGSLARWAVHSIPLCLAFALLVRGPWRGIAAAAAATCAVAVLATEVRIAAVAMVLSAAAVLILQTATRAARGPRLGVTIGAVVLAIGAGGAAWLWTVGGNPAAVERFEQIFRPSEDPSYGVRQARWPEAVRIVQSNPFGIGLGTAGRASSEGRYVAPGATQTDSAYLQVAIEQGLAGALLLFGGLAWLTVALARRAVAATRRETAAVAIGAAGTLVALFPLMYTGIAFGGLPAVLPWMVVGVAVAGLARSRAPASYPGRRQSSP